MEKQPQFPFAPKDFARCLNATCPRSQNCLRRTAALQDTDEHLFLKVVNPLRYPKEGEECELFRSTDKVRMAWGVTHLLDNVPYKEGSLLRNMIINHLGRSQYYRCFRKERPFAPQDNRPFACCSAREASAKSRHSTTTQMNLTGNIRHTVTAACNTLYDNSLPL